jgi:hypothetical protein
MTDDSGFGVPSTYGGVIPTPNMDRIANAGLKYTQFHSVALCEGWNKLRDSRKTACAGNRWGAARGGFRRGYY